MLRAYEFQDEVQWMHTSALMALTANINRGKNARPFEWNDFNPYAKAKAKAEEDAKSKEKALQEKHAKMTMDAFREAEARKQEAEAAKQSPGCVALLRFLATYGHRPITAARLTVADLDLERGTLTLNVKGGDTIRHAVLPATIDDLRPLIEGQRPTCPIFRTVTGLPYLDPRATRTRQRMPAWFRDLAARAGVKASIYDLKRLAVSRLFAAGADLATIASITGHRTPAVLLRYARTNEARQQAALQHIARQQTDARRTHDGPPTP
jgi:site-specific recombinase XerD